MESFEILWERASAEVPNEEHDIAVYTASDGKEYRFGLIRRYGEEEEGAFVPLNALGKALRTGVSRKNACNAGIESIYFERPHTRHGVWGLDAFNAIRFIVRYGKKEPAFEAFFRDEIFPRLAQGYPS